MNNHPTNRILYVLAAISVLLFAISFLFEEHAGAQSKQPLLTLESPNKKSAGLGDDLTGTGEATVHRTSWPPIFVAGLPLREHLERTARAARR